MKMPLPARRLPAGVCLLALLLASPLASFGQSEKFDVVKVAEGVYATIRKEAPGLWFEANNVFIINEEDVIVVDSNVSSASTREVLAALRKLTSKPVRYVVNTHWHEDHVIGNAVYRDAFPGVEFVGHASTLEDFPAVGASNRKGSIESGPRFVKLLRDLLAQGKNLEGGPLAEDERAGYATTAAIIEQYLAESPGFRVVLPTLTVEDKLVLRRGARVIEIRHLGRAHTGADLVVHLPAEKILIAGDLVVWPVPLVGSTSHPAAYAATLERLLALKPAVIIPGHGPVMRDDSHARLTLRLLDSLSRQTRASVARGETLEQARKSVDLGEFRKSFAGESRMRAFIFENYVAASGVAAAFREASAEKKP